MRTDLYLAWRHQASELTMLIGSCLAIAALSLIFALLLEPATEAVQACVRENSSSFDACKAETDFASLLAGGAGLLVALTGAAPFFLGVVLGAPLMAREIELGTASLAWSLNASRAKWLIRRVVPVAALVVVALLIMGQASETVALAASQEPALGFQSLGTHGPLVAVRGLAVLTIGVAIGLFVGRQLPAVLLTGAVIALLFIGLTVARDALIRAEAVPIPSRDQTSLDTWPVDNAYREDATGELISMDDWYEANQPDPNEVWTGEDPPGMTMMSYVVPGERYPEFVAREAGALVVVTVLAGLLAVGVIRSRRPL